MARIQLEVISIGEVRCVDSAGDAIVLPRLRLRVLLAFGIPRGSSVNFAPPRGAFIDTGAPLSVFPEREWRPWEDRIEWLRFAGGVTARAPRLRVLGGSYPYRMGRVLVAAADTHGRQLPRVPVIAQFAEDGGNLSGILMGMRGGILDGRRLVVDVDRERAWLAEHSYFSRALFWAAARLRLIPSARPDAS
jgi:hypothetical protein